jgi:hypothetical protein
MTKDIFEIYKKISVLYKKFENVGVQIEDLGFLEDYIGDMIMDQYGIPVDNSDCLSIENGHYFNRDYWSEILSEFADGKRGKAEVIKELIEWDK